MTNRRMFWSPKEVNKKTHPPAPGSPNKYLIAWIAAAFAFLLFAAQFVFSRQAILDDLSAQDVIALRYGVAGLIAVPLALRWRNRDQSGLNWRRSIALAATAGAPYFLLLLGGLSLAPASNALVINPGVTLLGALLLAFALLLEAPTRRKLAAAVLALTGLLLVGGADLSAGPNKAWLGNTLFVMSGLSWAVYMFLLNRWRIEPLRAAIAIAAVSTLYLPIYALTAPTGLFSVPVQILLVQGLFHGLGHALLAMLLFSYAVRNLGVARVALMTPLVPASGLIMSAYALGEKLSPWQSAGAILILCALPLASIKERR